MSESSLEGHLHRRCGGRYTLAAETVTIRVSGMAATVERTLFRCAKCGDEQHTVEQRETAEREAIARIRAQHELLTPKEIRQLRDSIGITHQQLGELLYGTPKEIVEGWERGRYLQNPQVDAMLRSLRDRETLETRASRAGVAIPTPEELAARAAAKIAARQGAEVGGE
ncbi:MAG TPA: type II TA system antitoxin MqsA family protein [Gemmatimonadaceae bacterium]|nr:type II TA system antitoxin MqsA family protein [Gemmatimonadaceae bacterium]